MKEFAHNRTRIQVRGGCVRCKWLFLFAAILAPTLVSAQDLNVPIVVQAAEWSDMATPAPTGTRTNAPVTFGIGIPDSAKIDCPGTPGASSSVPTRLQLQSKSGALFSSQFRCLAKWPSGNAEWVLVDAQLPSFSERSPGYDTSLHLVQVPSGGGNLPPSQMAHQCAGAGTPVAACPDGNHIVVTTGAATFLIKQKRYNLFDDVEIESEHLVAMSNHGPNDGLVLTGPADSVIPPANASPTIDSASCNPGPVPTNYSGTTSCTTIYSSNQDTASSCTIEENGPLRSVLMCEGDLKNSGGHVYMHWRTRMHFWSQHSDVKVTVGLRNADVPARGCCNPAKMSADDQFAISYKEFDQFEARITDDLGSPSSRNYDIANSTATPTTGTISSENNADDVYLYQGHSKNGTWPQWDVGGGNNCVREGDGCVVSYVPRSGSPGDRQYSQEGFHIVKNGASVASGTNAEYPVGWADLDDSKNGIEVGVYQLSMYWPKSLEFRPGTSGHNEIRVGIWPSQEEFPSSALNRDYSSASPNSAPRVAYAMGWPQYSLHDLYFNFHAGRESPAVAQNKFLYFQHYLLARPQSGTYYNSVRDATSGFDALFYDIPDPDNEDNYYKELGVCSRPAGQCLGDVGQVNYPYNGNYAGMKAFRYFIWQAAGGTEGTQFEQRESFLRNWLQRGGSTTTGSLPGRYVFASHWYRMIVEKSLPRSDTPKTSGPGAGFRSLCASQQVCDGLGFSPWGDPKNNGLQSVWNGGMRNWGDDVDGMEHSVYWGAFSYYFLSGDEWVKEQLLQGFKDRYQNPFVPFNNLDAHKAGTQAPGHGHINAIRSTGHWFSGAAWMVRFLRSIDDPDADTSKTVLRSPGDSAGTATVLQGIEQNIAASLALPYISSGYPKGWSEAATTDCQTVSQPAQVCSQGVSPVRGFVRGAAGGATCGHRGSEAPCDAVPHRMDISFQLSVWAEGIYDIWLAMRDLLGPNWHLSVGAKSGGGSISDGGKTVENVTISEKNLTDMIYASWLQMNEENCVNTGTYSSSGCVYDQFSDYLNSSSACTSSGDCLRNCSVGCSSLNTWFALAAAAPTTNSTADLSGKTWQFLFESQLRRPGTINMELGSHMMQFGLNYILKDASSKSNNYAVKPSEPVLRAVPFAVSPNPCVGPATGTSTCVITWKAPSGVSKVNDETYRLKYWLCPSPNEIYGTDCPSGGKKIVPALEFHSDTTTAGFAAADGSGSWGIDPSRNWNWAFTTDVPDCLPGEAAQGCNPNVPSGTSYKFNTRANTTYTFALYAYEASNIKNAPPPGASSNAPAPSAARTGNDSRDSPAIPEVGQKAIAGIDDLTQFSVQTDDLAQAVANCSECTFQNKNDLIAGQTTEVILRSGTPNPTADRIVLKQGALNGVVISAGTSQFVIQVPGGPRLDSVLVLITPGVTQYVNFPTTPASVEVGETLGVRGLLFRSGPQGGPTLIAEKIAILPAHGPR